MKRKIAIIQQIKSSVDVALRHSALILCACLFSTVAVAQESTLEAGFDLTGVVVDAVTQSPMSAVQVKALGTNASATTDSIGQFTITLNASTDVLQFKAFDYNMIEVPVQGRSHISVTLYSDKFTALYGDKQGVVGLKRSSHTLTNVSQLDDMGNPTSLTFEQQLQSKLGGEVRSITRSGLNGIGNAMFIRGNNSLHGNAQPLIVVDGVIWNRNDDAVSLHSGYMNNPLADISPSDIASVSVIKDGVSMYGSKGANGVIVIETKHGVDMATKIVLNATMGLVTQASSLPTMDKDQYRIYSSDMLGQMTAEQVMAVFGMSSENLPFLNDDPSQRTYNTYHNTTDWDDEVYKTGVYQNYDISVNGGDEKALYNFSVGYAGTDEMVSEVNMQQLRTRFNADINLYETFDLGMNIGFTNNNRSLLDDGVGYYTSPTYLAMIKSPFTSPYVFSQMGELTTALDDADIFGISNPNAIINTSLNRSKHYRFNVGLSPTLTINDNWSISDHFDYNLTSEQESHYIPMVGVADRMIEGYGIAENTYTSQNSYNVGLFNDARVQYKNTFDKMHHVDGILGYRYLSNELELDFAQGHNTGTDETRKLLDELDFKTTQGIYSMTKSMSTYVNLNYDYDNRYFVNLTASMDAASNFGQETQGGVQMLGRSWGIFPSLQAAWLISSEEFMASVSFVDRLKLRAGAGLSGNDDIDPYAWSAYFSSVKYIGDGNGLVLANYANQEIQWETSFKTNVGVDADLFNNRLSLSADVYKNNISNLLYYKNLPEVLGTGVYQTNGGEMFNAGYEISADVKVLNTKDLQWSFGANIGHYNNEVTALPDGDIMTSIYGANILTRVGESAGVFYGYKTEGVYSTAQSAQDDGLYVVDDMGAKHYFEAGDMKYDDRSGDGEINEDDFQVIGDPNPDVYGSFNTSLSYAGFTLNALFTFSYGNEAYNYLRSELESGSSFSNQSTAMLDRWSYEGHETDMPKVSYGDVMGNASFSDRWIEDASYLKFKTLSLNYTIPLSNPVIDGLEVWVAANNLFTFTNYLGRDPEFSMSNNVLYQGIDAGLMPQTTSYFLGVKINL